MKGFAQALFLMAAAVALGLGVAFAVGPSLKETKSGKPSQAAASPGQQPTRDTSPAVHLVSAECKTQYGFRQCTGFVENRSGRDLDNVVVVITWRDAAGTPKDSDEALISYTPILAGQRSPWSTTGRHNPELTTYSVGFKMLLGGSIRMTDGR